VPRTAAELHRSRRSLAELGRRRLVWGRRLAVGALALFGAAVTVAWLDPVEPADSSGDPWLRIHTARDVTYCGRPLDAPDRVVAVATEAEGRVEIPTDEIIEVRVVDGCDADEQP
jgi:hypothetical protein